MTHAKEMLKTHPSPVAVDASNWLETAWWIISRCERGRMQVLTITREGGDMLPVFSHEDEAELFLWSAQPGGAWQVREIRSGELGAVLCGPCASVEGVALDPLPEMLEDGTFPFVWTAREHFLERILAQEGRAIPGEPTYG